MEFIHKETIYSFINTTKQNRKFITNNIKTKSNQRTILITNLNTDIYTLKVII